MRGLLLGDKGISEMIGYVLLVVIAVSLGGLVFAFLRIYVPSNNPICPKDISLSVEKAVCDGGAVQVRLKNRGLFNLDGAYIRIGDKDRVFKKLLNGDNIRFTDYNDEEGLPPNSLWPKNGNAVYPYTEEGLKILEIEPAMFVDNEFVLCEDSIIKQNVYCTGGISGGNSPNVFIYSPQSETYPPGDVTFNYSVSNADSCSYILKNSTGVIEQGIDCNLVKNINLQEESYNFTVRGTNTTSGKSDFGEVLFDVQSNAFPDIVINDPKSISYSSFPIKINVSVDGLGTSLDSCWITLNDSTTTLWKGYGGCNGKTVYEIDDSLNGIGNEDYTFNVSVNNSDGLESSKQLSFTVDVKGNGNKGGLGNGGGDGWTKEQ